MGVIVQISIAGFGVWIKGFVMCSEKGASFCADLEALNLAIGTQLVQSLIGETPDGISRLTMDEAIAVTSTILRRCYPNDPSAVLEIGRAVR